MYWCAEASSYSSAQQVTDHDMHAARMLTYGDVW
jgi:hypothetical protein